MGTLDYAKRGFRHATSAARALPDFVIIGGMRCGSSALFEWISGHPDVDRPARKETHFFDLHYHRGVGWYRSFFPRKATGRRTFEATPSYLFHTEAAPRAASVIPEARFIALLREPADRAWSNYRFRRAQGREHRTFEAAIKEELATPPTGVMEPYQAAGGIPYLTAGLYAEQLSRWFDVFGKDRVLVLSADSMFEDSRATLRRVEGFTGLAQVDIPLARKNASPPSEPDPELIAAVRSYYEEPNRQLAELLDEPISWLESSR